MPPRVTLIGVTGYAACHLAALREAAAAGRLRIVAATVINRSEAEETCHALEAEGCVIHGDYRAMLRAEAGRGGLCVIPTAPHFHAEMACAALAAGLHVLLEKPVAPSLDEVAQIVEAERRHERWVAVGFQDLYTPQLRALRARLAAGEWGRVHAITSSCFWPRPAGYYRRNAWAGRLRVDGRPVLDSPVSNAMAHFVMAMLALAAPPGAEVARLAEVESDLFRAYPIETFDTFVLRARSTEGVSLRLAGSHACEHERPAEITVQTERARLVWRQADRIEIDPVTGPSEIIPLPDFEQTRRHLLDAVLAKLADPFAPVVSVAAAAEHTRLYSRLHEAHPVREAAAHRIRETDRDGATWRWIDGITEELLARLDADQAAPSRLATRTAWQPALEPTFS